MGRKIQYIGRYVMDGVTLGKGNFARVELATHGVTQTKVAIKVIDTKKIKEDYVRNNLHREARIMAQLRHPNIIRLYETLKTDRAAAAEATSLYCCVLEYCGGGELLAYIKSQKDQRMGESPARPFIRQLISALHYLHERGVVHRDLKMENIMLDTKKTNIKIIDFGLSNVYKEDAPLHTHCGSPEYAAPELFLTGKTYGPEIDIWSLGIITYAMIIGRLPFRTPFKDEYQRQQLLQNIQKGLSGYHDREMQYLSTDCRNLLRQLIEPNPELRVPLQEVEHHPWVTRNGKQPFTPFVLPPTDKMMKHQAVAELSIMMGLKKAQVTEIVSEKRADELSAMYNMILEEKKRVLGWFDIDHTSRKSGRRDRDSRSRSRDRVSGRSPDKAEKGKGKGPGSKSKVTNKSAQGKSTTQTKTKAERAAVAAAADRDRTSTGRSSLDREMVPVIKEGEEENEKKEVAVALPVPIVEERKEEDRRRKEVLFVEKARILLEAELGQERMGTSGKLGPLLAPPGSTTGTPKKAAPQPTANGPTRIPQRRGPLNLTLDLSKPPPLSPTTKIAVPSEEKDGTVKSRTQPIRPTSLPCNNANNPYGRTNETLEGDTVDAADKATGAIPKKSNTNIVVAPKATPEDLTLTTFSSSSSEANLDTMQQEMLNASEEKLLTKQNKAEPPDSLKNPPISQKLEAAGASSEKEGPSESKLKGLRNFLLFKHVTDSAEKDKYDSNWSQLSRGSLLSQSSQSGGSQVTCTKGSGFISASNSTNPNSNTCLLPKSGSEPLTAGGLDNRQLANPSSSKGKSLLSGVKEKECYVCGLSPSSPTYMDRHKKFCHTGAHALDVFVSPDENPSPTGFLWRPVMASTSSPHASPSGGSPGPESPVFKFPHVGAGTPRVPMQTPIATIEDYMTDDEDEDDDEEDYCHNKPLIPCRIKGDPTARSANAASSVKRTPNRAVERKKQPSREKYKKYSTNGVFTQVPDTSMRLEPVGAASSDSLSGASQSSRQGDGSTEKLSSGSKAKVHPTDKEKGEIPGEEEPSGKVLKSRIPRPAARLGKIQVFGLLQSGDKGGTKVEEDSPSPSPTQKQSKQKLLLRQYDKSNKQMSWRQGLSHLLRRTKSSSSNTNNNVSVIRNKTTGSNGTTANNVSKNKPPADRDAYYKEMDVKWTAPASPTHRCNSTSMQVTSSPVPSNSPSPVPQLYEVVSTSDRSATPTSPHHRSKHRKSVGWAGCKECAKTSDQSDDEGAEMSYRLERRVSGAVKAALVPQANDSRHTTRTTQV